MARQERRERQAKILVIEDEPDHWLLVQHILQPMGINPAWAGSPPQALQMLDEWASQEWELPKLILQDLYLPTSEQGLGLLKDIKAMPGLINRIPIVVLSGSDRDADIRESYQSGAASYCIKPTYYSQWQTLFLGFHSYWMGTVSLPKPNFRG